MRFAAVIHHGGLRYGRAYARRGEPAMHMGLGRPDIALGRYRLGNLIGRGATSSVYAAVDVHTDRPVAVKTIPASPELLERIEVEIRAAQRLAHPNIVRLLDWGRGSDLVYLVWELIDGPSLGRTLAERRPTIGWSTLRIIEILWALDHAHGRDIVHRDVKPENILIASDGSARLADFGVARLTDRSTMTSAGSLVGTIAYMSPEQARAQPVGPPSDVYSACVVLYELLVGTNPLAGGSAAESARRAATSAIPPISDVRPDLTPRLANALMAGLARNPEERPSAGSMAREFESAISGARDTELRQKRLRRVREPALSAVVAGATSAGVLSGLSHLSTSDIAIGAIAAAAIAAKWPRAAAVLIAGATTMLVGRVSVGTAMLVGTLFVALLLTGWRWPRHMGGPIALIAAAWCGVLPLACVAAAGIKTTRQRIWIVLWGIVLTVGWELWTGRALLLGPSLSAPLRTTLVGVTDPAIVIERSASALAGTWWLTWQAAALMATCLVAPRILQARTNAQRVALSVGWGLALLVVSVAGSPDPVSGLAAVGPSAILVFVWAVRPWRTLARIDAAPTQATLRGPIS